MAKTIILTGASGLLGAAITYELGSCYEIYGIYNTHNIKSTYAKSYIKLDLTDNEKIEEVIKNIKPDIVIHSAAMANVDLCEKEKDLAYKYNVEVTKNIAQLCKKYKIKLIYISTDYVYNGKKGNFSEEDSLNPTSFYVETKLEGEKAVMEESENYLILRVAIYGWNLQKKQSFAEFVIDNLRENKEIGCLTDQTTSMMLVNDTAKLIKPMIDKELKGIFNVSCRDSMTRYNMGLAIADIFNLNKELIKPITLKELFKKLDFRIAERPTNTSMNTSKLQKNGITPPTMIDSLRHMEEIEHIYKKHFVI